jgi:hypothetical protein
MSKKWKDDTDDQQKAIIQMMDQTNHAGGVVRAALLFRRNFLVKFLALSAQLFFPKLLVRLPFEAWLRRAPGA